MNFRVLALTLAIVGNAQATTSTLAGDTVDAFVAAYGQDRLTGFGLDAPFIVSDGTADTKQYSNTFKLNVDGDGFYLNFLTFGQLASTWTFTLNNLDFSSTSPVILSNLILNTNLTGVTFAVTPNSVKLNGGDVFIHSGDYFNASFVTSPVPEVSSAMMFAMGGLGILAFAMSKRRVCKMLQFAHHQN